MRYRLRLAKLESAVFVSHLGTMRAFERAVRRARLPVAYTEGYHPHPKYSFATALGVGMTSEAEYVDIELIDRADSPVGSRAVLEAVGRELPPGLSVLAVAQVMEGSRTGLASWDPLASYRGGGSLGMALAVAELLGQASFEIEIAGKGGKKTVDARPMVSARRRRPGAGVHHCLRGRAHLRPGDFLQLWVPLPVRSAQTASACTAPACFSRLSQGSWRRRRRCTDLSLPRVYDPWS